MSEMLEETEFTCEANKGGDVDDLGAAEGRDEGEIEAVQDVEEGATVESGFEGDKEDNMMSEDDANAASISRRQLKGRGRKSLSANKSRGAKDSDTEAIAKSDNEKEQNTIANNSEAGAEEESASPGRSSRRGQLGGALSPSSQVPAHVQTDHEKGDAQGTQNGGETTKSEDSSNSRSPANKAVDLPAEGEEVGEHPATSTDVEAGQTTQPRRRGRPRKHPLPPALTTDLPVETQARDSGDTPTVEMSDDTWPRRRRASLPNILTDEEGSGTDGGGGGKGKQRRGSKAGMEIVSAGVGSSSNGPSSSSALGEYDFVLRLIEEEERTSHRRKSARLEHTVRALVKMEVPDMPQCFMDDSEKMLAIVRKKSTEPRPVRTDSSYDEIPMENAKFEEFYKIQNILPGAEEWDKFMSILRTPLPTTFRITGSRSHATELKDYMIKEFFPNFKELTVDGETVPAPNPLPWYPNELGWNFVCSRTALRRSPEVAKFHKFLVAETEVGNISRQEAVSMIPVLFLDVKSNHHVFDMCAAPGSKTAQILEAIHGDDDPIPSGLVIANDADYRRSHMLVHQVKRLQSPCLVITNHDAQRFPYIYYTPKQSPEQKVLQFDRILCDVPCSGDGTLRKNKVIWKDWHQNNGNALHKIQAQILLRGVELLKVGGRIVYSTCSFNPVENEAVVAEVLAQTKGKLELLDVSHLLPGLKRRPGVKSWKVMGKDGEFYSSHEEVPGILRKVINPGHFPPKDVDQYNLERCIRIYPFLQDTGGFFVAVFEKKENFGKLDTFMSRGQRVEEEEVEAEVAATEGNDGDSNKRPRLDESSSTDANDADVSASDTAAPVVVDSDMAEAPIEDQATPSSSTPTAAGDSASATPSRVLRSKKEAPFIFLSEESEVVAGFREFYGLNPEFPQNQYIVRSEITKHRAIYFVSNAVKALLQASNANRLNVVNTGIKVFSRNEGDGKAGCPYRINNEGLYMTFPFLGRKRVSDVPLSDVLLLLREDYPKFNAGGFTEQTAKFLESVDQGSVIFAFRPDDESHAVLKIHYSEVLLPIWRAKTSASLLLNKQERRALLARLTGEEYLPTTKTRGNKGDRGDKKDDESKEGGEESTEDTADVDADVLENAAEEKAE
ncbi:tRNA (cytosine(34)-C(5))-methyltransferase [Quaeritorhiza haematococci]|nr:tRNA (cytosine(34)-C(5))-methyltransferase [Quaeritorhiza haematococci]